jgi:hypothetical protein
MGIAEQLLQKGILSVVTGKYNYNSLIPECLRFGDFQTKIGCQYTYGFITRDPSSHLIDIKLTGTPIIGFKNGLIISTINPGEHNIDKLLSDRILHKFEDDKIIETLELQNCRNKYSRPHENYYYIHTKGPQITTFDARISFTKELNNQIERAVSDYELMGRNLTPREILTGAFSEHCGDFDGTPLNKNLRIMTAHCGVCHFIDDTALGETLRDAIGENNIAGILEGIALFFSPSESHLVYPAIILASPLSEPFTNYDERAIFWNRLESDYDINVANHDAIGLEIPNFSSRGKLLQLKHQLLAPMNWDRLIVPFTDLYKYYDFLDTALQSKNLVSSQSLMRLDVQVVELPDYRTVVNTSSKDLSTWTIRYQAPEPPMEVVRDDHIVDVEVEEERVFATARRPINMPAYNVEFRRDIRNNPVWIHHATALGWPDAVRDGTVDEGVDTIEPENY